MVTRELNNIKSGYAGALALEPKCDGDLFEKLEQLRVLDEQFSTAAADAKEGSKLALENNLLREESAMDDALEATRRAKATASDKLLQWRKHTGIWGEKKKRGTMRTDLKLPSFCLGLAAKSTVYEFEKEWTEYKEAMEFSKEEAVKTLKQAIQSPARGDIVDFQSEVEIFDYLKKHHGNPMVLLNAREREIRAWGPCKGTDMAQRDWLIQAKSKLEATLKMCKEHNIERYLHFSSVASEVQSKFPAELTKDFKIILKKHLSPSGVLEKEKIIELLLEFMEDKILDCTLGVNLDIVNYLGSGKDPEQKGEPQKQNSGPTPGGSGDKPQQRPGQRHPTTRPSRQAAPARGAAGMVEEECRLTTDVSSVTTTILTCFTVSSTLLVILQRGSR